MVCERGLVDKRVDSIDHPLVLRSGLVVGPRLAAGSLLCSSWLCRKRCGLFRSCIYIYWLNKYGFSYFLVSVLLSAHIEWFIVSPRHPTSDTILLWIIIYHHKWWCLCQPIFFYCSPKASYIPLLSYTKEFCTNTNLKRVELLQRGCRILFL